MKSMKSGKRLNTTALLYRLLVALLCVNIVLSSFCGSIYFTVQATDSSVKQDETREEVKERLLNQAKNDGWDPYSADMSVEEFYALMELFDEGKLPLESEVSQKSREYSVDKQVIAAGESLVNESTSSDVEDVYIPRTKFLLSGISKYDVRRAGTDDSQPPLKYDNDTNYEVIEYATGDEVRYYYPKGLDPHSMGYMRPSNDWNGIEITDMKTKRVLLVEEGTNDDNKAVVGDVIQSHFSKYTGYYVKQVTIDGANINVLGMIELEDRCVYYYLSAEGQNTQVSTTTLSDEAKFIVEYVPNEHQIEYEVKLNDEDVTHDTPNGVVFYGSNTPTTVNWVESIFGAGRAHRTTDGAYSFDVIVPYGYELQILIGIDMTVDIPYQSREPSKNDFYVQINHTGKKEAVHDAWLNAYYTYLQKEDFVTSREDFNKHIIETKDSETGNITLKWAVLNDADSQDEAAHNAVLERMAERINDFILHNNGYALGTYPQYTEKGPGGFRLLPNEKKGPTEHTMNDTFYNHLVKADRTITAVLTKQSAPTFDVSQILTNSDGAKDRGASAKEDFALKSIKPYDENRDYYDADYDYHLKNGAKTINGSDDPLKHSAEYPNIENIGGWNWTASEESFFTSKSLDMKKDEDGTYYYCYFFQTNSKDNYYLDVFEVNGISVQIPYYPKFNWNNSYKVNNKYEIADETHPYYTEVKLADGATFRLEFLLGWSPGGNVQRHYRVTVTGARSNVVITGLNLIQYGSGSDEFATYNLTGVYSDLGGESQTAPAIEYFAKSGSWTRKAQSNVIVYDSDGINFNGDTTNYYGANIRFKIANGYGNPYYIWANRHGDPINNQTSVAADGTSNPIISLKSVSRLMPGDEGALVGNKLSSQYIYNGGDGYYYLRVISQDDADGTHYKIALLSVVARTVKYTVRYMPSYDPNDGEDPWSGFVVDDKTGEMTELTDGIDVDYKSMPTFEHDPDICDLWEMAKDETGKVPQEYQDIMYQYDDNSGPYYDLIYNNMATIASNTYGTIRPKDKNKNYTFVNWVVVGEDFKPVKNEKNKPIQFISGAIDFKQYADYTVKHVAFGNDEVDINVLRLMPVWRPINDPFTYNVVLNWVDALGEIHVENFSDYWDSVITEMTIGGKVYVYLNKDANPLLDWIANHPTYTFWDDVNNATTDREIEKALAGYLENGKKHKNYQEILDDLLQTGEYVEGTTNHPFDRMGGDIFVVNGDNETISVWMYEDRGGMIFSKEVQQDPFATDDEYYFTISDAKVGENYDTPLSGIYKAYPQFVYDENGLPRDRLESDAWLVKFEDGKIVSIDGDESVTYFTLKPGDGVALYVSAGKYTVTELGSKSGRAYKARVTYTSSTGSLVPSESWEIPQESELLWLRGSKNEYVNPDDWGNEISQVSATVNFQIGEKQVVQTLTFWNQTMSLLVQNDLIAPKDHVLWDKNFKYSVQFTLPEGEKPLIDDQGNYYYDMLVYEKEGKVYVPKENRKLIMVEGGPSSIDYTLSPLSRIISLFTGGGNIWLSATEFDIKPDEYVAIVMPVPTKIDQMVDYTIIETMPLDTDIWHLRNYQYEGQGYKREGLISAGVQAKQVYTNVLNDGGLCISNTVFRSDGKKDNAKFTYTLELTGSYSINNETFAANTINGTYGDVTFINGIATFILKDGESATITGLPDGLGYKITQTANSNYTTSDSGNTTSYFVANVLIPISFVNTRIIPTTTTPTETTKPTDPSSSSSDPSSSSTDPSVPDVPTVGYLAITAKNGEPNETFIYKVTHKDKNGNEETMLVYVSGGGTTLIECPLGDYTVSEVNSWSWRYENGEPAQITVTINPENTRTNPKPAQFTNAGNDKVWLGGENRENNLFQPVNQKISDN